jgi:hypothetical protein
VNKALEYVPLHPSSHSSAIQYLKCNSPSLKLKTTDRQWIVIQLHRSYTGHCSLSEVYVIHKTFRELALLSSSGDRSAVILPYFRCRWVLLLFFSWKTSRMEIILGEEDKTRRA